MAIGDVDLDGVSGYSAYDFAGKYGSIGSLDEREAKLLADPRLLLPLKEVAARSFAYYQPRWSGPIVGMSKCTRYVEEVSGEVTAKDGEVTLKGTIKFREPEKKTDAPQNTPPTNSTESGNNQPT